MALDLNALATRNAITTVDFMGQTAKITFNPSVMTSEKFTAAQKSDEKFTEFFTELVVDWDVKRGNKKVPLTLNGLRTVPLLFLRAVFAHIMRMQDGVAEEGKASSGG